MSISELYRSTGPIPSGIEPKPATDLPSARSGPSEFEKVFQEHQRQHLEPTKTDLKFSQHAETRIRSRMIPWNADLERRVNSGLDSAREKGSRETLILAGDVAVIANVKSRTVITAMDAANLKERIFTNIDSAVIV